VTDAQAQALIDAINRLCTVADSIFQVPTEGLAAAFGAGFIMPCTLYLVAHAVGSLVNFWRR
jgi:hypothetical protein